MSFRNMESLSICQRSGADTEIGAITALVLGRARRTRSTTGTVRRDSVQVRRLSVGGQRPCGFEHVQHGRKLWVGGRGGFVRTPTCRMRAVVLTREYVDVPVGERAMRTFVAAPASSGTYPGVVFYTDIFQLTESSLRWAVRLAGYGFVVAVPEIYHRIEPAGTVLGFDDEGKARGQADAEAHADRRLRRGRRRRAGLARTSAARTSAPRATAQAGTSRSARRSTPVCARRCAGTRPACRTASSARTRPTRWSAPATSTATSC